MAADSAVPPPSVATALRHVTPVSRPSRRLAADQPGGALAQQLALALVAGHAGGALELGARLIDATEPGQQIGAHRWHQVIAGQPSVKRK